MGIDIGLALGAVSAVAVPVGFGIGVVAMSKPSVGEFWFARICFIVAAIAAIASFAWLTDEMVLSVQKVVATATMGALVAVALVWSLDWVKRKETAAIPEKAVQSANPQGQAIKTSLEQFFIESDWYWRRLVSLPKNISDNDYQKLQKEIDDWSLRLEKYITEQLGPLVSVQKQFESIELFVIQEVA
jgi:hypothetical protein